MVKMKKRTLLAIKTCHVEKVLLDRIRYIQDDPRHLLDDDHKLDLEAPRIETRYP